MLVKLYNVKNDTLQYWELWDVEEGIITHWGKLGNLGEYKVIKIKSSLIEKTAKEKINKKLEEGYFQLQERQLQNLIIQIPVEEKVLDKDLKKREAIQNLVNECLGWTGNGHCLDADIGSGTINLFADVIEPYIACKSIIQLFEENNLKNNFIIALKKEAGHAVLFPSNSTSDFQLY